MSSLQLRIFNASGLDEFVQRLQVMEETGIREDLRDLVTSSSHTEIIGSGRTIRVEDFSSRLECGKYFFEALNRQESDLRTAGVHPVGHRGLWSWLGAAWFEHISKSSKGKFMVGAYERYILSPMTIRDYRHLLYGPWVVYSAGHQTPELIQPFMSDPVTEFSNFFEQIASRREILNNRAALELIKKNYVNPSTGTAWQRALAKQVAGGLERFGSVYSQLAVNFDLHAMELDEMTGLLPKEFEPWLDGSAQVATSRRPNRRRAKRRSRRK